MISLVLRISGTSKDHKANISNVTTGVSSARIKPTDARFVPLEHSATMAISAFHNAHLTTLEMLLLGYANRSKIFPRSSILTPDAISLESISMQAKSSASSAILIVFNVLIRINVYLAQKGCS